MINKNFSTAEKFYKKNAEFSKKSFVSKNLLPHRYVFILTNLCNLACTFCFQERKKRADRMSTENWLELIKQVPKGSRITLTGGEPLVYKDFEKDLDSNFHIDFIWSATNLRAWNYQLELASRHKAKMIAGKIIPAILTATASICGLMAIEILKIIRGIDDLSKYKSSSCNLGVNAYNMMEPGAVVKHDSQEKAENDLRQKQIEVNYPI